ncbi:MAG: hypothetical protein ACRD0H_24895 [Actinomycetes bacterium]
MRRPGVVVLVVGALGVLSVAGYLFGASQGRSPSATPPAAAGSGPVGSPPVVFGPVAAATDPVAAAAAWLRGYRQQSWADPQPWSWVGRVDPVVTGSLARDYQSVQGAGGGQEWRDFVARHCVATVTPPGGVIPPEAPRGAGEAWVQVTADVLTHCETGPAPGEAVEHVAATVELARGPDGLWRVSQRAF